MEEARGGHVPGALSRPYTADQVSLGDDVTLATTESLKAAYAPLLANRKKEVVVMCRTGHQASQTYFILAELLGVDGLRWYDGGWTEWAAHDEWPAEKSDGTH